MDYKDLKSNSSFIEVGSFDNYGGWKLDTQFIPNMGSAYLLAHGLGNPVSDAITSIELPNCGKYRLWLFTKDWVAEWKKGVAPGLFKVLINGSECDTTFGSEGVQWHWQDGGIMDIDSTNITITLHDLTGFEGRCGAIFLTKALDFTPPDNIAELDIMRRILCGNDKTSYAGKFDIVVAGAGIAGVCAALKSARMGLKVALIQDRPVVGGNNSSEARVWLGGEIMMEPYPNIGSIVAELEPEKEAHYGKDNIAEIYEDDKRLALLQNESSITLFMLHYLKDAKLEDNCIREVEIMDVKTGEHKRLEADLFVDSTGDATLGYKAGADFEITTNGHMGVTNIWYVEDTETPQVFPHCPWAIDLSNCEFPGRGNTSGTYADKVRDIAFGGWYWESGCEHDPIEKAEYARDTNFRAMYGAWDCVKNIDNDYVNYKIGNACYIGGKRESRRLFGDIILTKSDVYNSVKFDDACVPSTWNFDVHYPNRMFYPAFHEGDGFITKDYHEKFKKPYFIPYRCMYSRNIKNLFMAGRNVSVTHDALGTVRVMRTGGMMGEVIGIAARICKKYGVFPRDVYSKYLDEFIASLRV